MLAEARRVPAGTRLEADVCIVGAGAAGLALALALGGRGLRVVVLESGGLEPDARTQELYDGPSVGLPYFPLAAARLRYLGGTTGHWGGTCRPFDPLDFEPRPGIPHTGWPIGPGDLDAFLPAAAAVTGLPSGSWDLDAWTPRDRFRPLDLGTEWRTRMARFVPEEARPFGTRLRPELERAHDVVCYLHANVTELATGADGAHVVAARVTTLAGHRFSVRARAYVVACGAIENARLLLASDRHHPHGLGNHHDLVGRYFLEHPRFVAGVLAPTAATLDSRFYDQHRVAGEDIEGYVALPVETQLREGLVDVQLRLRSVFAGAYASIGESAAVRSARALAGERDRVASLHDVRAVAGELASWQRATVPGTPLPMPAPEVVAGLVTADPAERRALLPGLLGEIAGYVYSKLLGTPPVTGVEITARVSPAPNPDSRVTLAHGRDALGERRAQLDWRLQRVDRESVIRTLEHLGATAGARGIGRVRVLVGEDGDWPAGLAGGWHQMGTTRMSDDPRGGIVDRDCRVHGVSNLYVAGSSVFPTAGSGTPTLTLVGLALRLGAHLRRVLR